VKRRAAMAATLALAAACAAPPPAPVGRDPDFVSGVVFHDRDGDGAQDRLEFGVRGVAVSNGRDVVRTDWRGRYRLPIGRETIVFVIKPSGFATSMGANHLPRFYYIHKPDGSPADLRFPGVAPTGPLPGSVDFPLTRQHEPRRFEVLLFGDPQPYSLAEVDFLAHDIVDELVGSRAAFGITLGDIVGDDLSLFEPLNRTVSQIGIPWYNLPGNHDMNYDAEDDLHADETFERIYGPGTYAFEYGGVHFVALDDVVFRGPLAGGATPQNYAGGLSADQLAFVRAYLEGVPRDDLVVVLMHIPLEGPVPQLDVPEREQLFAILEGHPHNLSIAAHLHMQSQRFFGPDDGYHGPSPHHHWIQGTTSGSWWLGAPDELGIPDAMMRDGTPNGYSVLELDGNGYSIRYKVARRPAGYQMNIFLPDAIEAAEAGDTEVLVNVFAGSERTRVEMRLGPTGDWITLARVERPAPYFLEQKRREAAATSPPARPLPPADPSSHLWVGRLPESPPPGTATLEVRATDTFGRVHTAHRTLRIR